MRLKTQFDIIQCPLSIDPEINVANIFDFNYIAILKISNYFDKCEKYNCIHTVS